MSSFATVLTPILVLILVGSGPRRAAILPEDAWPGREKLTYLVLFPALLVRAPGNQSLAGAPWLEILAAVLAMLLIAAMVLA